MAILHPFRALRPIPQKAEEIACVPYDVINSEEARDMVKGRPLSFLYIIRPEIDLPECADMHADEVYAKGAKNLAAYAAANVSILEEEPALYVYRLVMNGHSQTGIFGCVSVSDYDSNVILKHELTRPEKEDDRTRHIVEQSAHAEPVMLTYRDDADVSLIISSTLQTDPLYDLRAQDGVQHTIWRVADTERLVSLFKGIEHLYIADGHHRCKAASRSAAQMSGKEGTSDEVNYFPAVLFPMGDMMILAYNRVIKTLPVSQEAFLRDLKNRFQLTQAASPVPDKKGDICVYLAGSWHAISLPLSGTASAVASLDVGRLTDFILIPMLGIKDPRRDPNIDFVGGIRGTDELERYVDSGRAQLAISMYPTSIKELVDVSDAGLLMPPKSTWFEPKLRSGLLVHLF